MLSERSQTKGHIMYDSVYKFHLTIFIIHGRYVLQRLWEHLVNTESLLLGKYSSCEPLVTTFS